MTGEEIEKLVLSYSKQGLITDGGINELVEENTLREVISELLNGLDSRERKVIELRFGLNGNEIQTLEQIGKLFNVTRERIKQIETKALRRLRHPTRTRKLRGFMYE